LQLSIIHYQTQTHSIRRRGRLRAPPISYGCDSVVCSPAGFEAELRALKSFTLLLALRIATIWIWK